MQQRGAAAAVQDVPVRERGRPPADSLRNYLLQVSQSLPQPAQPRNPRKISYFIGSRGYFILDLRPGILQIGSVERGGPVVVPILIPPCALLFTQDTHFTAPSGSHPKCILLSQIFIFSARLPASPPQPRLVASPWLLSPGSLASANGGAELR